MADNNTHDLVDMLNAARLVFREKDSQMRAWLDAIYQREFGFSALEVGGMEDIPTEPAPVHKAWCTSEQIGSICTPILRAILVDHLLEEAGYQILVDAVEYKPTPKAHDLCLLMHGGRYAKDGTPIMELLWDPSVANIVTELYWNNKWRAKHAYDAAGL